MKKLLWVIIFPILLITLSFSTAFAIPELQLYIEGATYDGTQTWVITSSSFRLWVLGNVSGPGNHGSISNIFLTAAYPTSESGSISITPTITTYLGIPDPSIPGAPVFVQFGGDGTIPLQSDGSPLSQHGIFMPGTSWTMYSIGNFTLTDSPVADLITTFPAYPGSGWTSSAGQINAYNISVSGYSRIHFDAFDTVVKGQNDATVFAPYSHDAGGTVPEPGILILLGIGLTAAGVASRWIRRI